MIIMSKLWTQSDVAKLIYYYKFTPPVDFNLVDLSQQLGRTIDAIIIKAGRLNHGLTNCYRKKSIRALEKRIDASYDSQRTTEYRATVSERMKQWRATHPDHKPARGCSPSLETRQRMSNSLKEHWKKPDIYQKTPEYRQLLSDRFSKLVRDQRLYTRGWGGRRKDLDDRYFRSSWEANYARYLNFLKSRGEIHDWQYESNTFWFHKIKRGTRSYTPDFKVWQTPEGKPRYD